MAEPIARQQRRLKVDWGVRVKDRFESVEDSDEFRGIEVFHPGLESVDGSLKSRSQIVKNYGLDSAILQDYYDFLRVTTHPNIIRVGGSYLLGSSRVISFDPVHTSLLSFLYARFDQLTTGDRPGSVIDFRSLMISFILAFGSVYEFLHNTWNFYGDIDPSSVFVEFDDTHTCDDPRYATLKLFLPHFEKHPIVKRPVDPTAKEIKAFDKLKVQDWRKLGSQFMNRLLQHPLLQKQVGLATFRNYLQDGHIYSLEMLKRHPQMLDDAQIPLFVLGGHNMSYPAVFKKEIWHQFSDRWPQIYSYAIEMITRHENTSRHDKYYNTPSRFSNINRTLVSHFETSSSVTNFQRSSFFYYDRASGLRYLRYHHPCYMVHLHKSLLKARVKGLENLMSSLGC